MILEIKENIRKSQYLVARSANRELLLLYFQIGRILSLRIREKGWGSKILKMISRDIQAEFPGIRGFSIRTLFRMSQLYEKYSFLQFVPSLLAQLSTGVPDHESDGGKDPEQTNELISVELDGIEIGEFTEIFLQLGFTHHSILINKCVGIHQRFFYMKEAVGFQWSSRVLEHNIESRLFERRGKNE